MESAATGKSKGQRNASTTGNPRRSFVVILVLIPFIFFLLLEGGLRLFGYGVDTDQWMEATDGKILLNHDVARRYFHTVQSIPISNQDLFDKEKKPGAFRVFVLGESSGAGYPYTPIGGFPRWLKTRLEIQYPQCTIEIVNLSLTAVSSYTLRDLFPGVVEQDPDLVLIYSGHNEYYGALGVGSTESLGSNRAVVLLTLALNKYKTVELLRGVVGTVAQWFSGGKAGLDGTLMSRMAREQSIPLNSDSFRAGLSQYEKNMRDILDMAADHGVPVILSTLTNNLKDQKPFISAEGAGWPAAADIYQQAAIELQRANATDADSLFRLAKDLDLLRFRSSEAMNLLILQLGREYDCPVVPIDSIFSAASPQGIIGDNLMTDHLHPTIGGYHLMARAFQNAMREHHLLPDCDPVQLSESRLDSLALARFAFTRLDSVIARYRIVLLKNDWPYTEKRDQKKIPDLIRPGDFVERAALDFLRENGSWEEVQRTVAEWYLTNGDHHAFRRQMDVLISQYPVVVEYYDHVANELLKAEEFDLAYEYLERRHAMHPTAYSAKWLGIISLSRKETNRAIRLLEESLRYAPNDAQVLYNIAGAYSYAREYTKALEAVSECLSLNPSFPNADRLRQQLQKMVSKPK